MDGNKSYKLVLAAIFCALVFVMTRIAIPTPPVGNINLGDCMVILCACLLGNSYGIFAAAIGAALCDLASGYAIYVPATFVIKALMVGVILIMQKHIFRNGKYISLIIPVVCAEIIMVAGYFVYEALVLGYGIGASANVPFNLIQGALNIIVAGLLLALLEKTGLIRNVGEKLGKKKTHRRK